MGGVSTMYGTVNNGSQPTFNVTGNGSACRTNAVNGLTLNQGAATVSITQTTAKNVLLALGGITRNTAGMVNFVTNGTFASGVNAITTTTANDASGILGGWASCNGIDYAANDGSGNIVGYPSTSYTSVALNAAIASNAVSNVRLNSGTGPATLTAAGVTGINTLLQNTVTAENINIVGGQTLAFGANGGIMIGTGKSAVYFTNALGTGTGTVTAGGGDGVTPGELNIMSFGANGSGVSFASQIADNGSGAVKLSVSELGTGNGNVVTLWTANSYSGGTVINSGRVSANDPNGFGTGPVTVLNTGQAWPNFAGTMANDFNISGASTGFNDTPSAIRLSGSTILTGKITLLSDAAIHLRNNAANYLSGQITGNYNFSIGNPAGTGTETGGQIYLSNPANNWTGNLLINGERISLGASEVIPNGSGFGDVIFNNSASAILDLNGYNETINGLSSQFTVPFVQDGSFSSVTLALGDGNATATFSGVIRDSVGSLGITKIGSGVQTFTAANTYSGATTVSNGTLVVSSAQTGAGAITVNDGATFGVTALLASQLAPSLMTVGSSTGATLQFDLDNSGVAPINPGSLTINGTATVNIKSCPGFTNAYPLINNYGSGTVVLGSQPPHIQGFVSTSLGVIYYNVTNVNYDTWTAAINTNWDITTANWTNNLPGNHFTQGDFVRFDDTPAGAGPFAVSNAIVVQPAGIYVTNSKNYSVSGLGIAGSGSLTKDGFGTLTFSNVNTFTGPTIISAGLLQVGGAGQLGGGAYSALITDNGILNYGSSAAQTLSGVISGSGALVNSGPGVLTLSGVNSYTGGTTNLGGQITAGNNAGNNSAFGTGPITLSGGTTLLNGMNVANAVVVAAGTTNSIGTTQNSAYTPSSVFTGSGFLQSATSGGNSLFIAADWSQFAGTIIVLNNPNGAYRFGKTDNNVGSGSNFDAHQADFVVNNGANNTKFTFADQLQTGITFRMGSLSGTNNSLIQGSYNSLTGVFQTLEIGANNKSTSFYGVIGSATAANNMQNVNLTKVGTGTLTLSGLSGYIGTNTLVAGIVSLAGTNNGTTTGPLGAGTAPIMFAGGTLQFSATNQFDYATRIMNSASPISIDVNGTNVTFAGALPASNTGGLALTNSTGNGRLTLKGNNLYSGNTIINAGTLALSGSGNIGSSANIIVPSGRIYDVSGVTGGYILGSQTLLGSGSITGAVATASLSSSISPATNGVVGTLTFNNNLNLSLGASPVFDLSTSSSSGNDQIVVGGNLTMGSSDIVHIHALSGAANLDQSADYVLFNVAGTTTRDTQPSTVFDGTAPANATHFTIQKTGNNIVLHYSAATSPTVVSVVATNTVDGTTNVTRGQTVTVFATVAAGAGVINNVSVNLSSIGGPASQVMNNLGGDNYSYTTTVGSGATVGNDLIGVTVTDTTPLTGSGFATLTVNASTETWNGQAVDNKWSSGTNWVSTLPPGFSGDNLIFAGSTQTTSDMDNNYGVASLTFDSTASNFTITNASNTLTLNGGITNSSGNPQALDVPIALGATETISAGFGVVTLGGAVSGPGGLIINDGTVTLSSSNSYVSDTTVSGTLVIGNSAAIPSGAGNGNVLLAGTLDLNGTNAAVNGLTGAGTVDNTSSADASILTIGNNNQSSSLNGALQNSGGAGLALVKVGTGSLALPSAHTYTGGTTISNGLVTIGNVTGAGTGVITLAGGTLQAGNINYANAINVVGNVSYTNSADNADGSHTGALYGSGTLTNITVATGQSWKMGGDISGFTGTFVDNGTAMNVLFQGTTDATRDGSHARWVLNNAPGAFSLQVHFGPGDGTFRLGELSGTGYIGGDFNSSFVDTYEIGALNTSSTFSGPMVDGGGTGGGPLAVTKVGTGTLTLTGTNTYTGATTVSNGTLNVTTLKTGGGSLTCVDGTTLGVAVVNGGYLLASSFTLGNNCTNAFSGIVSTSVPVVTNTGVLTLAGTVTVNAFGPLLPAGQYPLIASAGGITGTGGFVVGTLSPGAVANIITNGNTIVLNVTTSAIVNYQVWTGASSSSWDKTAVNWTVSASPVVYSDTNFVRFDDTSSVTNVGVAVSVAPIGILVTNNSMNYTLTNSPGVQIAGIGALTKSGTGTLTLTGTNTYSGGTTIANGTLQLGDGLTNNGVVAGNITDNASLTIANPLAQTYAGVISGTGTLLESGPGVLTLSSSNTFGGGLTVSNGTVVIANVNALGTGNLTLGGGTIQSGNFMFTNNVVVTGNACYTNTGDNSDPGHSGALSGSGTLTNISAGASSRAFKWAGDISGFTGTFVDKSDTNNATIFRGTNAPDWDGSHAKWVVNNARAFGLSFVPGGHVAATFKMGELSGTGKVLGDNGSDLVVTYEVGALNTSATFSGTINDGGGTGGGLAALTKVGTGSLTLSGMNAYTGMTTVSNGTLQVNGSLASGAVTVAGGNLGGTGAIGGPATVNANAYLAAGNNGIGTLTFSGNLTLNAVSTNNFVVTTSGGASNKVAVAGMLSPNGSVIHIASGTALSLCTNTLFTYGTISGSFHATPVFDVSPSGSAAIVDDGAGHINLVVKTGVNTNPTNITAVVSGNLLILSWPADHTGWRLRTQNNSLSIGISTNWVDVPGAASVNSVNVPINAMNGSVFFQMVYP
jgi:autotransporter-associated beta strand protein